MMDEEDVSGVLKEKIKSRMRKAQRKVRRKTKLREHNDNEDELVNNEIAYHVDDYNKWKEDFAKVLETDINAFKKPTRREAYDFFVRTDWDGNDAESRVKSAMAQLRRRSEDVIEIEKRQKENEE